MCRVDSADLIGAVTRDSTGHLAPMVRDRRLRRRTGNLFRKTGKIAQIYEWTTCDQTMIRSDTLKQIIGWACARLGETEHWT